LPVPGEFIAAHPDRKALRSAGQGRPPAHRRRPV